MSITATEAAARQSNAQLRAAMDRLLYKLRRFVGVYPIHESDKMPENDVQWMAEIDADPAGTILEAVKAYPELWVHALPDECCIVPVASLKKLIGEDGAEALGLAGQQMTITKAMRARHEIEDRERRERHH